MNFIAFVGMIAVISVAAATVLATTALATPADLAPPLNTSGNITAQSLDVGKVTTSWDLSFLYKDTDAAKAEYKRLELAFEQINLSFRPGFNNLTGDSAA